jgi:hypothetical protein
MRTHYGPWQPCWISNQHQKHKSGRGPSSEHFWQVWLKSVQRFQRRRFKCEKLTDRRTLTHDKSSHGLWPGELKTIIWPSGQSPTKVITVRDTPLYGHAPTYQISLTYLERQKCYGPDKKILFKKQLFDLEVKSQGLTKVITVCDTPPYGHAPTYQI